MEKESPNLELISRVEEKRKVPRLLVTSELFKLKRGGKVFSVVDLSESGMALYVLSPSDLNFFELNEEVDGQLNLRGEKINLKAKVKHVRSGMVGLEFSELDAASKKVLKQFIDPASLGSELKRVPISEKIDLWYHAPSSTDLFLFSSHDAKLVKFVLYAYGQYVQWDLRHGVVTGIARRTSQINEEDGPVGQELVETYSDLTPDSKKVKIAVAVLKASRLDDEIKQFCLHQLSKE